MKKQAFTMLTLFIMSAALMMAPSTNGQSVSPDGDVMMEFVGQTNNPSPTTAFQYGYVSYVKGVDSIFSASPQNQSTALLTFYNETVPTQVITNGNIRIINRMGTMTIYLDTMPNGDFSNRDSFRDGIPVLTMALRHQVVLDTVASAFTATFINTVTSSETFTLGSQPVRLGEVGQKLRITIFGHTTSPTTSEMAGFAVAIGSE
jgi:hypothetical protein